MIVTIGLQRSSSRLLARPETVSRGSVYIKDSEGLMTGARGRVVTVAAGSLDAGVNDWSKLKNVVRDELSNFFWKKMKRILVILPIILDVNWTCKRGERDVKDAAEYRKTGSSVL